MVGQKGNEECLFTVYTHSKLDKRFTELLHSPLRIVNTTQLPN